MMRGGPCESWLRARLVAGVLARALRTPSRYAMLAALPLVLAAPAQAQVPVRGTAVLSKPGNYARLVFKLQRDVEADVRTAGSILIVRFQKPVDVNVGKLADAAPDYVSMARTDPDGSAVRLALARKVTPNVMVAGERLFIDLLPDNWTGPPPPLPAEVIKELADRAKEAERLLRQKEAAAAVKKKPPIRVRASTQPTFTRYVFELPGGEGVSTILNKDRLTLNFDVSLTFDLADAIVASAPNVASITQNAEGDTTAVTIMLIGDADVHAFREEKNYVVDIGFASRQDVQPTIEALPKVPAGPPATVPRAVAPSVPQRAGELIGPSAPEPPKPAAPQANGQTASDATPAAGAAIPPPATPSANVARDSEPPKRTEASLITGDTTAVTVKRDSEGLRLTVPFATPTAAAMFVRADALWMVFDSEPPLDISQITRDGGPIVRDALQVPLPGGQAIRIRLNRPQLVGVGNDGQNWIVHAADTLQQAPQPLVAMRNIADHARASVTVPLAQPGRLHRLIDPDAGDVLLAITAPLPARGFVKRQNFVEFTLLESVHGIVLQPNSEDVQAELAADKVVIGRPGGLTLSPVETAPERAAVSAKALFDVAAWRADKEADFIQRRDELWRAAAEASGGDRAAARLELTRFYMAHALYPEARATIDAFFGDQVPGADDSNLLIVRALAHTLSGFPDRGLKDLANPAVGAGYDARVWKAIALARLGKWADARELFKGVDFAIGALPVDLQRIAILDALRASLEVRDYAGVSARLNELDIVGVPADRQGYLALLRGRMAQALGREKDALADFRAAAASSDRISASEAKLYEVELAQMRGEMSDEQARAELETLAMTWRGDLVEVRTLQQLARLYEKNGSYREALLAARMATRLYPNAEPARQMQDAASALFVELFNGTKADEMPPVQALALFYEFQELTPIGRRGDEIIRRLADRLASVDLLDQASELLQYQIDHRLEGSARAHVASKLAMLYLTNRKPDRALAALRATRIADLAGELRQQRLLLEARAQSDVGRHDLAIDIIANLAGREAIRLRSDIFWAARRWREASEQIELLYGERWKDFQPLTPFEKGDIIRAAIGYSLADDAIGLSRLKEKFAAKLAEETDREAFGTATQLAAANSAEFAAIAKMAASVDTLDGFLREMRHRFPEMASRAAAPQAKAAPDPMPTGALPAIKGTRRAEARR
ncbi:hypothetical protein X566_24530 [Afipia sp. P52-10]|nr:hypothetical protein X566_24530 [Afipia sp. P52-10]